jgi:hypothetical protein
MLDHRFILAAVIAMPACASGQLPQQQLMDTQAAIATTEELGGNEDPDAKLHLEYARDQLAGAKRLIARGDDEEANRMLARASADAELALELARTEQLRKQSKDAWNEVDELRNERGQGGAADVNSGGIKAAE